MPHQSTNSRAGLVGGVLFSILPNLAYEDVARTVILAIIGTTVSFFLTLILRWLVQHVGTYSKSKKKKP